MRLWCSARVLRCKTSTSRSRGQIHRCRLNNRASRAGARCWQQDPHFTALLLAHSSKLVTSHRSRRTNLGHAFSSSTHAHHRPRPAPEHSAARPFAVCTRPAAAHYYLITWVLSESLSHSPSCASLCVSVGVATVSTLVRRAAAARRNRPRFRLRSSALF